MPVATSAPSSPESPKVRSSRTKEQQFQNNKKKRRSLIPGDHNQNHNIEGSPLQPTSKHDNILSNSRNMPLPTQDDHIEKANRRKSAHFGDLGVDAGNPTNKNGGGINGRRIASAAAGGSISNGPLGSSVMRKVTKGRLSTAAPSLPPASLEVMSNNFEEWMKLATDNKITATNTWNFALIDYFADLTLLRNGPDDQSINFQKASCTLDGCVKIWTSRVDSVATETGKLLSGLAGGGGGDAEDPDAEAEGDDEEGGGTKATKKTYHRSEATLAKSFAALQIKKFDLEFTVDPLFKKTSADFDEGGAMGLLMNHLGVDGRGRVVFDAGDAGLDDEVDEEVIVDDEEDMIDLSKLREFIPSMEKVENLNISDTLSSFKFSSDPSSMPDITTLLGLKDSWDKDYSDDDNHHHQNNANEGVGGPSGETHDFFGDENFDIPYGGGGGIGVDGFDDGASMAGDYDIPGGGGSGGYESYAGGLGLAKPGEGLGPFDPRRQGSGGQLVMAPENSQEMGGEGMFDYFDKRFGKAWAGAQHWKLKKVSKKDPEAPTAPKITKASKAPFSIDFTSPATSSTSSKILFAPASRGSLSLPSSKTSTTTTNSSKRSSRSKKSASAEPITKGRENWLLPDDMHFNSRQLLRLFLKPKFAVRMRKDGRAQRVVGNDNAEIDENFWAEAAADHGDSGGMGDNAMPVPFESQFFHDMEDDGDAGDYAFVEDTLLGNLDGDEGGVGGVGEEDDLWQGTQGQTLKRARPENVNFAKKAKRVDVKRLKDDIWSGLRVLVKDKDKEKTNEVGSEDDETPITSIETPPTESKTFDSIITNLRTTYPSEKMSEISTSFCFICLLHLANEEGLRIETARTDGKDDEDVGCMGLVDPSDLGSSVDEYAGMMRTPMGKIRGGIMGDRESGRKELDEGERRDRIVGELQALRVFKDPNAGRAA